MKPETQTTQAQPAIVDRPEVDFERLLKMGSSLLKTGFLPASIKTADQTAMIILTGRELGIPAMQSLRTINVIQGKPALSAELMAALVLRAGNRIEWIGSTETDATCRITRKDGASFTGSFTIAEARRAKLVKADGGWEKYPAALLRARALSLTARAICPDAIAGFYIPEELGADVDEAGAPVVAAATVTQIHTAPEQKAVTVTVIDARPVVPADEKAEAAVIPVNEYEHGIYTGLVVQVTELKKAKTFYVIEGSDNWKFRTFDTAVADFATQAMELKGEVRIEWIATKFGPKALNITATGDGATEGGEDEVPF